MARNRIIKITVCDIEHIDGALAEAKLCIEPLITYLKQHARTAADAQAVRNAMDTHQAVLEAQRRLLRNHPQRRE